VDLRDQSGRQKTRRFFYGWWIVGVGVLTQIAGVFSLSSTLSVFLKPVTEDLGISRGAFSLVRTGEVLISAAIAPLIVLREVVWANYFGRLALGTVRGMGLFLTQIFAACGAPFFGLLFDATGGYFVSSILFVIALLISAVLIMLVQPPKKPAAATV
jgi:hypothetical protein